MQRHILIAFPRCILHHDAAAFSSYFSCHAHSIVIIDIRNIGFGTKRFDSLQTRKLCSLRHQHDSFLLQTAGSPGNASAMIAVGSSNKDQLAQLLFYLRCHKLVIGKLFHRKLQTLGKLTGNSVAAAQNLEGIQAEAIAFILNINILNTKKLGQIFQTH